MDESMCIVAENTRKRKATKEASLPLDELNQDILERVLSWLPTSIFFRLNSVCKRWRSVSSSPTFRIACSNIPLRDPWFLMVDQNLNNSSVFDCSEHNWKNLSPPKSLNCNSVPVASAGGLVCFRRSSGELFVVNPVTNEYRELPMPPATQRAENEPLHAIAMCSSAKKPSEYRIILVSGEFPKLSSAVFDSAKSAWEEEVELVHKSGNSAELQDETLYFLSKAGDVVAANMQRSPCKQYSSVVTIENGERIVYFLNQSGKIVGCNLARRTFFEYPRLLPVYLEYSIDIVECKGEMLVVMLSELLDTASLRVWRFSEEDRTWKQVAAMPPSMSHEFYGKKADINCSGFGDRMFVCVNSSEINKCVMFDMVLNVWVELPEFVVDGKAKEFMSAFSFEPRLEATV